MEHNTKQYLFSRKTAVTGERRRQVHVYVTFCHHKGGGRSRSKGLSIIKSIPFQLSENNKAIQTEHYLMLRIWWDLVMEDAYLHNSSAACLYSIKGRGTKKRSKKAWGAKRTWRQPIRTNLSIYIESQTVVFTCFKSKGSEIISQGSDTKCQSFRGMSHLKSKVALTSIVQKWQWHCELFKSYHLFSCQYLNSWTREF